MPDQMNETQANELLQMVAQIRAQWEPVIEMVVAACQGNAEATAELDPFLADMEQKAEWQPFVGALKRVLAGERDPLVLLPDLDDTDVLILSDILRMLGVDPRTLPALPGEEPSDDDGGNMITLDDFMQMIVVACKPGAPDGLKEQMQTATRGMAMQPNVAPELNALGRTLNAILNGDRRPNMTGLPPELVQAVNQMLKELPPTILLA